MIKKCIIPVAGKGTRFHPITKCIPKEMLPINNKPIIHYVLEEAIKSGITDIALVTRKGKTIIEDYIDIIPDFKNIYYIRQKEPLGLGDAILQAEGFIGDDSFSILLGDELFETNSNLPHLKELIDLKVTTTESIISINKVPKEHISNYGVVELGNKYVKYGPAFVTKEESGQDDNPPRQIIYYSINGITEKPLYNEIKSEYATTGRYVLTSEIFKYLKRAKPSINNEIQLTDAINIMIKDGYTTYGLELDGLRWDVGTPDGYYSYLKSILK